MNVQKTNFVRLESTPFLQTRKQKMLKLASQLSQALKLFFESIFNSDEPNIHQSRDRFGNVFWTVYDPITGCKLYFESEAEVRIWLDRRYYQL